MRPKRRLIGAAPAAAMLLPLALMLATDCGRPTARATTRPVTFPEAVVGDTRALRFHVAARSATGSVESQTRAALDDLLGRDPGARIVRLRVFAVGQERLVEIQKLLGDLLLARQQPLPALSLLGVSALPAPGQLIEMESIAVVPQAINPRGVAFLAGFASPSGDLTASGLAKVAREAGVPPANIVRVSCFYESPDQFVATRKAVADTFPSAEVAFVQSYAAATPAVECEAVGRLVDTVTATHYFNLPGTRPSPNFSRAALVGAPRIAFTGTQLALGDSQADMRALLEHAHVVVASLGGTLHDVVMAGNYWRTASARDALRPVRNDAYTATVPAATGIFITTLPSPTATVALELTVALPR